MLFFRAIDKDENDPRRKRSRQSCSQLTRAICRRGPIENGLLFDASLRIIDLAISNREKRDTNKQRRGEEGKFLETKGQKSISIEDHWGDGGPQGEKIWCAFDQKLWTGR